MLLKLFQTLEFIRWRSMDQIWGAALPTLKMHSLFHIVERIVNMSEKTIRLLEQSKLTKINAQMNFESWKQL